jgi:hypothetical protein
MISDQLPMDEREADEAMKKRFLKAYKKGLVKTLFTYSGKRYLDVDIKNKSLLRLNFPNEAEKVAFLELEREKINCRAVDFPELGRKSKTANFMNSYRMHRIGLRDIKTIFEFPDNYAVYFTSVGDHQLPYVSLEKDKGKDGDFARLLQLLIQANAIFYQNCSHRDRPRPDMGWTET